MASIDRMNVASSTTLAILGCGTLGSAILFGLLSIAAENSARKASNGLMGQEQRNGFQNGHTHAVLNDIEDLPKPKLFIACVRTSDSAQRLRKEFAKLQHAPSVAIVQGENVRAVQAADTILLGCQPQDLASCIGEPGAKKALRGKLLISILAGVTIPQIEGVLEQSSPSKTTDKVNAAARTSCSNATPSDVRLVKRLFTAGQFDACTALCGSTPAFFALFIESLLDGAIALGLKRSEAQIMAAQTMKGAAMLMLAGEQPDALKEKVATPGGSKIKGLLELERKALRGTVADALIRCTAAASILGVKQA